MGVVYRAEDPRLKREVALKVMLPQFAADSQAKARFVREARAQAKVEHDHVAAIFTVADHDGLPYLVMPLLKGRTLQAALKANPRPPLNEVIRIGREVAEGLAAAHEKGLVHRDIKPANIWLEGKKLRVKVLDFGLARIAEPDATTPDAAPLTRKGVLVGTPSYMSPEQGRGLPLDGRSDLWSLGVMLYQMTTGELPFVGDTSLAILTSLSIDNPVPPVDANPAVPLQLSDFVLRLLSKDPAERPPTAEVAGEELRAIETGLVNAVRVIPLDAPPPIILALSGPDPFADLDATEVNSAPEIAEPASEQTAIVNDPSPKRGGFPMWAIVAGVLLAVSGIIGLVASQFGKKSPEVAREDPPQVLPPQVVPLKKPSDPLPATYKNSIGMDFMKVPKGTAWLGGDGGNPGETKLVIEQDFYLGKYEVTQEEWENVLGTNPSVFRRGHEAVKGIADADLRRFPVEQVSWDDCQVFLDQLNRKLKESGWVYRLQKASEWEYACRGGPADRVAGAFDYYFAKPTNTLSLEFANYAPERGKGLQRPCTVGSHQANVLGLYDMHGNVHEWCDDSQHAANGASFRVGRGGGWNSIAGDLRAMFRNAGPPSHRSDSLGLRLARVPLAKAGK